MTVDDAFRLTSVSSPALSPDGALVAYVVSTRSLEDDEGRSDVWVVPVAGGEPRRMTWHDASASSPEFSPDGRMLTFLASRGEDAETQVWAMDLGGGEARALTGVAQGVGDYAWAPDSGRLALSIRNASPEREPGARPPPWVVDRLQFKRDYAGYLDRRRVHVFMYDIRSKTLTRLTEGDYDHSSISWSPDGSRLAFTANRTEEPDANYDTDVWVVDVAATGAATPAPTRVSPGRGSDTGPTWSTDGSLLAWGTSLRPEIGGYAMSHVAIGAPGAEPRVLTAELDRTVYALHFSRDGRRVLGILESGGAEHLVSVSVDGSGFETLLGGARSVRAFEPLPGGGAVVLASAPDAPAELWRLDPDGALARLTRHNDALLAELSLGPVVRERVTAPDGTELDAFYTFPPGFRPPDGASGAPAETEGAGRGSRAEAAALPAGGLPTILWIHGGPMGQDGWAWHTLRHLFAAHGYLVVQPNYRGSHGYGQDFALGLWQDWGGPERVDAIASVDHAIELGWADPERLGVGGWSYGAITTNAVITHTDRFAAAISGAGAALYVAAYGHDQYQRWYEQELGLPWENHELWDRISPFWRVDRITTPTLWMGGERDWNVPINQGELMYQSMKRLGRETLLVVYPGQGHGGFPPVYEADRYRRFLGWFGRYLLGDDSLWPAG